MNNVYVWIPRLVIAALGLSLNVAHADVVVAVIVNPAYQGEKLSPGLVRSIYLGENNSLTPVDQGADSIDRQRFLEALEGVMDMSERFKRHWSKLIFSGRARPPNNLSSQKAVLSWVASNPAAIGYVDSTFVDSSVKVVLRLQLQSQDVVRVGFQDETVGYSKASRNSKQVMPIHD